MGEVGKPIDRVDGRLKVTGGAVFAAETPVARVVHALIVSSPVGAATLKQADLAAASNTSARAGFPTSSRSASSLRQGLVATPPSATRAVLIVPATSSTTAADASANANAARSRTLR